MTESMYTLINREVLPILFNKIMAHSSHTDKGLVSPSTVENDPNPLIIQMLEKIDPLKDSLHINSSQTQANADIIAQEIDL